MGPLSMMSSERRGYDPILMQSEEKIPMDQLYTDTQPQKNPLMNFLFGRAEPTILPSNDPRIRDEAKRSIASEIRGGPPSLSDVVFPSNEERLIQSIASGNESGVISSPLGGEALVSEKGGQVDALKKEETPVGENLNKANEMINTGGGEANPDKYEILQSMYGKYSRDPKARKQQYLDQISKIYRNAMILNAIAELTGGRSQAGMYVKMATDKLDVIEKFDNEERMHGIWKDVFFDQSGQFRSPANWQETYNAAIKLGATPEEAKELADTTFGAGGGKTTAAMQNFAWYNSLTGAEKELAARILKIDQNNVATLSPSNLVSLVQSDAFLNFSEDEQRRVIAIIKKLIPGFEANVSTSDVSTPQQKEASNQSETREEYEEKVRKRHPKASEEDIQATVNAKYPNG
jgi:hypothetical protein